MNRLPGQLVTDLVALLRDRHADELFSVTLSLLGDQVLPEPRESGVPAALDTATVRLLIRTYAKADHLAVLAPVLGLVEPFLPVLIKAEPIIIDVPPARPIQAASSAAVLLSSREIEVLVGMANGYTNSEIGRALYLSEDTVKTHARKLFKKLGSRDRAHAVRLAYEGGLLPVRRSA